MKIISIKEDNPFLTEYISICSDEWGKVKTKEELDEYILKKKDSILNGDKVISILGLIENENMIGFISLFKYDGDERRDLTPWYATMYVKEKYRGLGYSKVLNEAILKEAKKLGYDKIYLKSELGGYYEKFGAKFLDKLKNGEKLYYIEL